MDCVQERIGNTRELIYNNIYPQQIYYDSFNDPVEDDKSQLPYGEEIHEAKLEEVNDRYMEALDRYINAKVIMPNKNGIPVLTKVKGCNSVVEHDDNPILDTRV